MVNQSGPITDILVALPPKCISALQKYAFFLFFNLNMIDNIFQY